jgi:hypothetical protein
MKTIRRMAFRRAPEIQKRVDDSDPAHTPKGRAADERIARSPLFYTTLEIQVPTLADVFAAMQRQPEPSPEPGPAFRTQEECPPVADSGGGGFLRLDCLAVITGCHVGTISNNCVIAGRITINDECVE